VVRLHGQETGLTKMVMNTKLMTMSARWNVAAAKAELSLVLKNAQREPQVIERRGEPVAVIVGIDEYNRLREGERRARQWKDFLELSAALRAEGGVELEVPKRRARPSPFARTRR
jgi:prevent-host-death family protein